MKRFTKTLVFFIVSLTLITATFAAPAVVTVSDSVEDFSVPEIDIPEEMNLLADGSESMPYTISSAEDFNKYAALVNTQNDSYGDKYYKLTGNIDFSGVEMVPFGYSDRKDFSDGYCESFKGTLDGDGYALLNVEIPDVFCSGPVGYMTTGTVKNLRVDYKDMDSQKTYTKVKFFGGIVGYADIVSSNKITITDCETSGDIRIYSSGNKSSVNTTGSIYVGGILGRVKYKIGNISNCVTDMSFDIEGKGNSYVGGFAAYLFLSSSSVGGFENCISYGDVSLAVTANEATAGGFCGYICKDESSWTDLAADESVLFAENINLLNCAFFGNVYGSSNSKTKVGSFAGDDNSHEALVITGLYYNTNQTVDGASGKTVTTAPKYGTAMEQASLKSQEFYKNTLGFDLENEWFMSISKVHLRKVAKSYGAAVIGENKDIRLTGKTGIRFNSLIDTFKRDYAFEYGFLVAVADELGDNELTFDYEGNKINGVAYDADTDIFSDHDDDYYVFSGVVHSIPGEKYSTELVARTYVKYICDEKTVIVYGNTETTSVNLSASAIRNNEIYESLTEEQKVILETMLPVA